MDARRVTALVKITLALERLEAKKRVLMADRERLIRQSTPDELTEVMRRVQK